MGVTTVTTGDERNAAAAPRYEVTLGQTIRLTQQLPIRFPSVVAYGDLEPDGQRHAAPLPVTVRAGMTWCCRQAFAVTLGIEPSQSALTVARFHSQN